MKIEYPELLWPFLKLPESYLVLDLETTGLIDEMGAPSILTIGIVEVQRDEHINSFEYQARPLRRITKEAMSVHGITELQAESFPELKSYWDELLSIMKGNTIVIHNAAFDWVVLNEAAKTRNLSLPDVEGVFCSQKSSFAWAAAVGIEVSARGPSLDSLTKWFELTDIRSETGGLHGALIDATQTANLVTEIQDCICR